MDANVVAVPLTIGTDDATTRRKQR